VPYTSCFILAKQVNLEITMTRLHHFIVSTLCLLPSAWGDAIPAKSCKAYPGTSDWPSRNTWLRFNDTLGGKLLAPTPPGAVCHGDWSTYNKDTCSIVAAAWKKYDLHAENPVSVIYDQYSNWTCLPNPDLPCSGSGYSAYVVNVTKPEHIKIGIDFGKYPAVLTDVYSQCASSQAQYQTHCQEHWP
jgi:hypothetical protein